jgi:hypothetical protein
VAALGAWLYFEDEAGFSMTPPTGYVVAIATFCGRHHEEIELPNARKSA